MSHLRSKTLSALLAEACPNPERRTLTGPGAVQATVRPHEVRELAALVSVLRRGMVPWTVGPLPEDLRPNQEVVVIDTSGLTRTATVCCSDGLVRVEAGVRMETLARLLRGEGYELRPAPERMRLGEALATSACRSKAPGSLKPCLADRVVALELVLPDGELLSTPLAPRRATGPDLAALAMGSEGALGCIAAATLRVDRVPERVSTRSYRFATEEEAAESARRLRGRSLSLASLFSTGRDLHLRFEGALPIVRASERAAERLLRERFPELEERSPTSETLPPPPQLVPPSPAIQELTRSLRAVLDPSQLLKLHTELV